MKDVFQWFGYAALGVTALSIAANQAAKDAPVLQRLSRRALPLHGRWTYLPWGLFLLGIGALSLSYVTGGTNRASTNANTPSVPIVKLDQSDLTVSGLPIDRVMGFFEGRTDIQAVRLIEAYHGVEVTVSGPVFNVIGYSSGGGNVSFLRNGEYYSKLRLIFEPGFSSELARLEEGDPFSARCLFKGQVDRIGITLEDCEPSGTASNE